MKRALYSVLLCAALTAEAGALREAKVTRVANLATVREAGAPPRAAREGQVLGPAGGIETRPEGRAEVLFADQTLLRLGGDTAADLLPGTRDLALQRGTVLVQVPALRSGVKIRAGGFAIVASRATALVAYLPGGGLKVVAVEGELRIAVEGFLGDSVVIRPGKLLLTDLQARLLPEPVDIDLAKIVATSGLVNGSAFGARGAPVPSEKAIAAEIQRQGKLFGRRVLVPTNLAIFGSGTQVVMTLGESE